MQVRCCVLGWPVILYEYSLPPELFTFARNAFCFLMLLFISHFATDAERAQGYPNHDPAGSNAGAASLIDNVIQRLLHEQAQSQRQAAVLPVPQQAPQQVLYAPQPVYQVAAPVSGVAPPQPAHVSRHS